MKASSVSVFYAFCVLTAALACGCGKDKHPSYESEALILVKADIEAMNSFDGSGAVKIDEKFNHLFTSIFGDTTPAAVSGYFNERVHYEFDPRAMYVAVSPGNYTYEGWSKEAKLDAAMKKPKGELGAANLSTELWFQGLLDHTTYEVLTDDETIPVTSSRTGIILLAEGYKARETAKGITIELPTAYRQAILIHEARHSDCTGGISSRGIETGRDAINAKDFMAKFPDVSCGHFHVFCPKGHPMAGLAACDKEPWGAYAVGGIYALAQSGVQGDELSKHIMQMESIDDISRFLGNPMDLLEGKLGVPDMSSNGTIRVN